MTYDFEVYSAAQDKWLEVSSVSRFDTFQTNRLKMRFKSEDKKTQLCHTLNGSALALPRIVAALLENFQTEDGIWIWFNVMMEIDPQLEKLNVIYEQLIDITPNEYLDLRILGKIVYK